MRESRVVRDTAYRPLEQVGFQTLALLFGFAVALQFVEQGLQADAEDFGGAGLVAFGQDQGSLDEGAFGVVNRCSGGEDEKLFRGRFRDDGFADGGGDDRRRQMAGEDDAIGGEDDRAFEGVAEFADVPGPAVMAEQIHGVGGDIDDLGAVLAVEVFEQGAGEDGDVVEPVAERGEENFEDVEAVEEILAELVGADGFG